MREVERAGRRCSLASSHSGSWILVSSSLHSPLPRLRRSQVHPHTLQDLFPRTGKAPPCIHRDTMLLQGKYRNLVYGLATNLLAPSRQAAIFPPITLHQYLNTPSLSQSDIRYGQNPRVKEPQFIHGMFLVSVNFSHFGLHLCLQELRSTTDRLQAGLETHSTSSLPIQVWPLLHYHH